MSSEEARQDTAQETSQVRGKDARGKDIGDIGDLWTEEQYRSYYDKADEYWKTQEASVKGVMGGFDKLSKLDLAGSAVFLQSVFKKVKCGNNVSLGASSSFFSSFSLSLSCRSPPPISLNNVAHRLRRGNRKGDRWSAEEDLQGG